MHFSGEVEEREERLNKQKVVAWVGIDWADEGHEVWDYTAQTGQRDMLCDQAHGGIVAGVGVNQLRIRHGGKPVAVVLEQARGGFDLCTHEHGFHGNLSRESGIV